ncbi:MAG: FlgB family protein [Defluviimonas denitrificans]
MFAKPEILTIASSLSAHAMQRQALIAENVANADTPGYRARDIPDFRESYLSASPFGMNRTREGHLGTPEPPFAGQVETQTAQMSPNGNSVSLETEMVKAADTQREHDLALAVYGKSLDILRASLGRR